MTLRDNMKDAETQHAQTLAEEREKARAAYAELESRHKAARDRRITFCARHSGSDSGIQRTWMGATNLTLSYDANHPSPCLTNGKKAKNPYRRVASESVASLGAATGDESPCKQIYQKPTNASKKLSNALFGKKSIAWTSHQTPKISAPPARFLMESRTSDRES
jgi:hypothetical protein